MQGLRSPRPAHHLHLRLGDGVEIERLRLRLLLALSTFDVRRLLCPSTNRLASAAGTSPYSFSAARNSAAMASKSACAGFGRAGALEELQPSLIPCLWQSEQRQEIPHLQGIKLHRCRREQLRPFSMASASGWAIVQPTTRRMRWSRTSMPLTISL